MARAFEGIKVVDFSQVLAGPFATQQLAFQGADIIKVEPPGPGESGRHIRAVDESQRQNMSAVFLSVNAGKRSFSLDLKHPKAREILFPLIEAADVVVQNFKVGVIDRLGFGYGAVRARNPAIVYCAISGYGQSGPKAHGPAYDPAIQAASGMMQLVGTAESGPLRTGFPLVDMVTGLTAAVAITAALYRARETGQGQFLDVAMLDSAMSIIAAPFMIRSQTGRELERQGNKSQLKTPTADVFETADGELQVTALTEAQIAAFCDGIGIADLLADPRYATPEARVSHRVQMREAIVEALDRRTAAEWEAALLARSVPVARVLSMPEALRQPQLEARNFLLEMPPLEGSSEPLVVFNAAYTSPEDPPGTTLAPPEVGADTDDVLRELGFSAAEIQGLRAEGCV